MPAVFRTHRSRRAVLFLVTAVATLLAATPSHSAPSATYVALDAGHNQTCGIRADASTWCWGLQGNSLGDGTYNRSTRPVRVKGLAASQISAGKNHSCAVDTAGAPWCWGYGTGVLGTDGFDFSVPGRVVDVPAATSISAGGAMTCAVKPTGGAWCWGSNYEGQLGSPGGEDNIAPREVTGLTDVKLVTAGDLHACAVTGPANQVWCWGYNYDGESGYGDGGSGKRRITGVSNVVGLAAGFLHTCALRSDGKVACWGRSTELGRGPAAAGTPVDGLTDVTQIAATGDFTCAVTKAGEVWCWGSGGRGQLGDGAGTSSLLPVRVAGVSAATAVAVGGAHACAVAAGAVSCWGENSVGQLGDGTTNWSLAPVPLNEVPEPPVPTGGETRTPALPAVPSRPPASTPRPTPAAAPAAIAGSKLTLTALVVKRSRGSKACPATAKVTVTAAGTKRSKRTQSFKATVSAGTAVSCVVSGSTTLRAKLRKRSVRVVVTGKGLKSKTLVIAAA